MSGFIYTYNILNSLDINVRRWIVFGSFEDVVFIFLSDIFLCNQWVSEHPVIHVDHLPNSKLELSKPIIYFDKAKLPFHIIFKFI